VSDTVTANRTRTPARMWLWTSALLTLGALAAGAVLAPPASVPPVRALTWLLFVGSSVHVAATGYLFTLPDVRAHATAHRARYLYGPVCLVVMAAATTALLGTGSIDWLLLAYFGWQFFHFQKQNLGMVALAAHALGLSGPRTAERRSFLVAGWAGIVGLVVHPELLQLHIATHLALVYLAAACVFVAAVCRGLLALLARPSHDREIGYTVVSLSTLGFFAPVFLFHSPYAAVAGMTIAHGLQYLALVGLVAAGDRPRRNRLLGIAIFVNVALIGGVALSAASHLHGGPAAERFAFGAYLGLVMVHFVVDAGLWRLRDPFPRAFLSSRVPYLVAAGPGVSLTDRSSDDI
jgi:hypothetical protein